MKHSSPITVAIESGSSPAAGQATVPTKAGEGARHLPWLDWLRFLAAFAVMLSHARGGAFVDYGALEADQHNGLVLVAFALTRLGQEAVLLFFVLSGFLVGGRLFDRVMAGEFRVLDYTLDRVTRIFIPLLPAIALTLIASYFLHATVGVWTLVANTIGLQEVLAPTLPLNPPLWSLSFEIWFYVLGGCVAWLVQARRMAVVPAVLFIASLAVFTELGGSFLFCWVLGAVAWRTRPRRFSWALLGCGVALTAAGLFVEQFNRETVSLDVAGVQSWLPGTPFARLVLAAGYALVLQSLILCHPSSNAMRWLEHMGNKLAACSYTLYLTHYPLFALLGYLGWKRAARVDLWSFSLFAGAILFSGIVTWVLYFLFESRTSAMRRWARSRITWVRQS